MGRGPNVKKNPLYVVTNKGRDVEEVRSFFDVIFKRLGLDPLVKFVEDLLHMLLSHVTNFAMFLAIQNILDEFIAKLGPYIDEAQGRLERFSFFAK